MSLVLNSINIVTNFLYFLKVTQENIHFAKNFLIKRITIPLVSQIRQYSVPLEAYFSESTAYNQCHSNFNVYEYEFNLFYVVWWLVFLFHTHIIESTSCLGHLFLYFAGPLVETWIPTGTQVRRQCSIKCPQLLHFQQKHTAPLWNCIQVQNLTSQK